MLSGSFIRKLTALDSLGQRSEVDRVTQNWQDGVARLGIDDRLGLMG